MFDWDEESTDCFSFEAVVAENGYASFDSHFGDDLFSFFSDGIGKIGTHSITDV